MWDLKRNRSIYSLEEHDKPVHVLCLNDKYLFSGSGDKTIKVRSRAGCESIVFMFVQVWDLKSFECLLTLEGHARSVKALCVSGTYLFSGSNDKTIKVFPC